MAFIIGMQSVFCRFNTVKDVSATSLANLQLARTSSDPPHASLKVATADKVDPQTELALGYKLG